jgi:type II secretory pathway predicted ATPase ExeA
VIYLEHFGLREAPFGITPHTDFFFTGANRGGILDALTYAAVNDEGIIKVSGEVGSGKTMLCRKLLEKLPKHVETVYLPVPSLSRNEMLEAIAHELGVALPDSRTHRMMLALQAHLLEVHASGRRVVVLIDEAHAMPDETLEEVRLLSNLESERHKLLHIILFGQPELDERLNNKSMRQLRDRITHNFWLAPLHLNDIGNYLMYRLRAAGYRGPDLFSRGATRILGKASGGLTRRLNILADKCLLAAFADGQHGIDDRHAKAAVRDLQPRAPRRAIARRTADIIAVAAAALIGVFLVAWQIHQPDEAPSTTPANLELRPNNPPQPSSEPEPVDRPSNKEMAQRDTSASHDGPSLAERITSTAEWVKATPDDHYFIQLLSTDGNNDAGVQHFIGGIAGKLDARHLRVYRSDLSGRDRLGVIYGDFATWDEARAELAKLAETIPEGKLYIRAVSKLK